MFDTFHISMPLTTLNHLSCKYILKSHSINIASGKHYLNASYQNIRLTQTEEELLVEGSFRKLVPGFEVYTPSYIDNKEIVEVASEILGVNLFEGYVRRIDLEGTFDFDHSIEQIKRAWIGCVIPRMKKREYDYSKSYSNSQRRIIMYDKAIEFLKNEDGIIRLETSLIKNHLKKFAKNNGLEILQVKDLFRIGIYKQLVECWYVDYLSLVFDKKLTPSFFSIKNPKELTELLALLGVKSIGGFEVVEDIIQGSRVFSNPKSKYRAKQKLRALHSSEMLKGVNIKEELDIKIHEKKEYQLCSIPM